MMRHLSTVAGMLAVTPLLAPAVARADSPFATAVIEFAPAPGQFVNDAAFDDPARALGPPSGGGLYDAGNSSLVSLGGFGGSITLAFDHTVANDPANAFGLDITIFSNAIYVAGDLNRRWAEPAVVEVSRDTNGNGLADDAWYLIPGSHVFDLPTAWTVKTWDANVADATYPPANPTWIPPGKTGTWTTAGYALPPDVFNVLVLENPNGPEATAEGVFGYADHSPTLLLGDTDADDLVDDPFALAEQFYVRPDNPLAVGITPGSGGGDAFDLAWAIDPATGAPAELDGCNFVRITTTLDHINGPFGEMSAEIDAVADVAATRPGDVNGDDAIDGGDAAYLVSCLTGPGTLAPTVPCRPFDFDADGDVDLNDARTFQEGFNQP